MHDCINSIISGSCRVRAYINNGWADTIVDPDGHTKAANESVREVAPEVVPDSGWRDIKAIYTSPSTVPNFTNAQILTYFVTRTVSDRLQCGDFKSVSQSAVGLFRCVEASSVQGSLWIRAKCLPQMKKDRVYKLLISLNDSSYDIIHAQCECMSSR